MNLHIDCLPEGSAFMNKIGQADLEFEAGVSSHTIVAQLEYSIPYGFLPLFLK